MNKQQEIEKIQDIMNEAQSKCLDSTYSCTDCELFTEPRCSIKNRAMAIYKANYRKEQDTIIKLFKLIWCHISDEDEYGWGVINLKEVKEIIKKEFGVDIEI